jgi:hypothetical protein
LGVNPDMGAQYVGYYFRTVGEADVFRVDNPGLTDFLPRTTYSFVGGAAEVNATLFQNMSEMEPCAQGFTWTRNTSTSATSPTTWTSATFTAMCGSMSGGSPLGSACCPGQSRHWIMSISLTYDRGTDKTTLVDAREYQLQLTLKYWTTGLCRACARLWSLHRSTGGLDS